MITYKTKVNINGRLVEAGFRKKTRKTAICSLMTDRKAALDIREIVVNDEFWRVSKATPSDHIPGMWTFNLRG